MLGFALQRVKTKCTKEKHKHKDIYHAWWMQITSRLTVFLSGGSFGYRSDNCACACVCFELRFRLRTFAGKFSNIDFFLRLLPLKVDELVMSEM